MTTMVQGGMSRRVFLVGVAGMLGYAALKMFAIPHVGEVTIPNEAGATLPHSVARHGLAEVGRVHEAMKALASTSAWFFKQPPCKDGRYRFIVGLPGGDWAVWVLERVADGLFREVTAFVSQSQDYVKSVDDQCGNGDWFGHSYAR